jgi:hypothetical protein
VLLRVLKHLPIDRISGTSLPSAPPARILRFIITSLLQLPFAFVVCLGCLTLPHSCRVFYSPFRLRCCVHWCCRVCILLVGVFVAGPMDPVDEHVLLLVREAQGWYHGLCLLASCIPPLLLLVDPSRCFPLGVLGLKPPRGKACCRSRPRPRLPFSSMLISARI